MGIIELAITWNSPGEVNPSLIRHINRIKNKLALLKVNQFSEKKSCSQHNVTA